MTWAYHAIGSRAAISRQLLEGAAAGYVTRLGFRTFNVAGTCYRLIRRIAPAPAGFCGVTVFEAMELARA